MRGSMGFPTRMPFHCGNHASGMVLGREGGGAGVSSVSSGVVEVMERKNSFCRNVALSAASCRWACQMASTFRMPGAFFNKDDKPWLRKPPAAAVAVAVVDVVVSGRKPDAWCCWCRRLCNISSRSRTS